MFSLPDVAYLRSDAGVDALAAVAELELSDATRIADIAAARARFGDRTPLLVETVLLRRRASEKLGELDVSHWLFTDEALQQATAAPVAVHRAGRLAGPGVVVHDVTCSIGTELAALRARGVTAVGSDIDPVWQLGFDGEIEVTSCRGSVREACLWSAGLTQSGVRRRATVLDRGEQITDADPDGAVVRAGLVRHYGARHGLWQLDPDIAYLSGDRLPATVRGLQMLEQLAFDERRLRQALTASDCGALEVLVRGVRVDPDALRKRMRLRGSRPLSVVITRIGARTSGQVKAFVCQPSR
ncbi:methyltransferase [Mycobacterium lepraemurium]|nr:class I SAM-dependent methyltransferase [Mycobacterium lepraemurium]ATA29207.1 methyltransferase [Mycobacterium lepraemurium]